jgi:hypothetical protein
MNTPGVTAIILRMLTSSKLLPYFGIYLVAVFTATIFAPFVLMLPSYAPSIVPSCFITGIVGFLLVERARDISLRREKEISTRFELCFDYPEKALFECRATPIDELLLYAACLAARPLTLFNEFLRPYHVFASKYALSKAEPTGFYARRILLVADKREVDPSVLRTIQDLPVGDRLPEFLNLRSLVLHSKAFSSDQGSQFLVIKSRVPGVSIIATTELLDQKVPIAKTPPVWSYQPDAPPFVPSPRFVADLTMILGKARNLKSREVGAELPR